MIKNYVKFIERNEWEGETWRFYIPLEGNESALKELEAALRSAGGESSAEYYELSMKPIPESKVDALVEHSGDGYMAYHNKLAGTLTIAPGVLALLASYKDDPFYKGGIKGFMKTEGDA